MPDRAESIRPVGCRAWSNLMIECVLPAMKKLQSSSRDLTPSTDLQMRVLYIEEAVEKLRDKPVDADNFDRLCYLTGYLCKTILVHLKTGEK
jgi:hypothetical protein